MPLPTLTAPPLTTAYQSEWAPLDPAPRAFAALNFGGAAATGMLFDAEYLRTSVFFQEFFHPVGLEECLGGNLSSRNGHFALVGLQRGPDRRAFKRGEIHALEAITPHLGRALQLRGTFVRLGAKLNSLVHTIDRLAAGVIVLGSEGGEIHVNRAAREIAARNDGVWLDAVKFHLKTAFEKTGLRSQARLLQAVARALADLGARRHGSD
jgi:hypothetical protein